MKGLTLTLFTLGTSSCNALILSAIRSRRNCTVKGANKGWFYNIKVGEGREGKTQINIWFQDLAPKKSYNTAQSSMRFHKKSRDNFLCVILVTYTFSNAVWIRGLSSSGPHPWSHCWWMRRCSNCTGNWLPMENLQNATIPITMDSTSLHRTASDQPKGN